MANVYALLVGINEYVNVTKLRGCVDDIESIERLLHTRLGDRLQVRKLLNGDATRANIIQGFQEHLGQATASDVALFYYCGHGSFEPCPAEWSHIDRKRDLQTIVPVDARANGVFDIADKELVALHKPIADRGAHLVSIFDSCHSGTVTRDANGLTYDPIARMTPSSTGATRTLADYHEAAVALYEQTRFMADGPPNPTYITISACQDWQTAKEYPREAPTRGTFTVALEEALDTLGPTATYLDVLASIRTRVRVRADDQLAGLTVSGNADASGLFLSGLAGRRDLTIDIEPSGAIWLSAGTAGGVPEPKPGQVTGIAIHPRGALSDLSAPPQPIATAEVSAAMVDRAMLRQTSGAALDPGKSYIGVITQLATPQLAVVVQGEPADQVTAVRNALIARSGLFAVAAEAPQDVPSITAQVSATGTALLDAAGTPLRQQFFAHTEEQRKLLLNAVDHLTAWYGIRDRTPLVSTLNGVVKIDVAQLPEGDGVPVSGQPALVPDEHGAIHVKYGAPRGARVAISLRNTSGRDLYAVFVLLGDTFGANTSFFSDLIPKRDANGDTVRVINGGTAMRFSISDPGANQVTDTLKVFVSKSPITAAHLQLNPLIGGPPPVATRGSLGRQSDRDTSFWGTTQITLVTHR